MEALLALLLIVFVLAVQIVVVPFCLMVVLGLLGVHLGFFACLAIVIVVRAIFGILRGN